MSDGKVYFGGEVPDHGSLKIYSVDDGTVSEALNSPAPKRWDCPCECGGYALYGWRKCKDDGLPLEQPIMSRRHGVDVPVDPEQNVLFVVMSRSFYDDGVVRMIGYENPAEIDEQHEFMPPMDQNLLSIWLAVGLKDALLKEFAS